MKRAIVAFVFVVAGCEGEECRRLTGLVGQYEETLQLAVRRADNAERFKQQADQAQVEAEATLKRLGLDLSEELLVKDLLARIAQIPGATHQRRVESFGPAEEAASNQKTIFMISFAEKDPTRVWAHVQVLIQTLPIWRFELVRPGTAPGTWEVELARAIVERLPISPKATPLPDLPDPSTIPSELRLCGAAKLRLRLADLKTEIDGLRESAASTTMLLPALASWKGLNQRALAVERVELQSRVLLEVLFQAAISTKSKLKAVGYQEPRAVLEVHGGEKERLVLERALAKHRAAWAPPTDEPSNPNVVRFMLVNNAVPEHRREPEPGGAAPDDGHGHGPGGH